jgi:hypothetical protein
MAYTASTLDAIHRAEVSANIEVPAEPAGFLEACKLNFSDKGAALGQQIVVPVVVPTANKAITPGAVPPSGDALTPINVQVRLTNPVQQDRVLTAEDMQLLDTVDSRTEIMSQWMAQGMRAIRNEIDGSLSTSLTIGASRAIGTPGTVPFQKDLSELAALRRILRENGAPMADMQFVGSVGAYTNMLNLNVVAKAMEAGSDKERRSGVILNQFGVNAIRESANILDHTSGSISAAVIDGTAGDGTNVGAKALGLKSVTPGSTGFLIGDVFSIASDSHKYVANPKWGTTTDALTDSSSDMSGSTGLIYIGNPGLKVATADSRALTFYTGTTENGVTGFTPSFLFERHALVCVMRPPVHVEGSVYYNNVALVKDKFGYTYMFAESVQHHQTSWFLWSIYGSHVTQSEYVAMQIGKGNS